MEREGKRGSMNREKNNELAIGFMGEKGGQFFFPFFCPGRRDTACSMLADKNGRVRWTQHAGCIKDLISFGALPFNGMFSIAMFPLYIGLIHAHEANRATSIRFAFLDL